MRVFTYISSLRGENSKTYEVVNDLIDNIRKRGILVEDKVYTANDVNIKMCRGCMKCYEKGNCIMNSQDDMEKLCKEMLEADLIILGSPVYVHSISGSMKIFIDRLCVWFYLFALSGKLAINISMSNTNGNDFVDQYLNKISNFLGAKVIENLSIKGTIESKDDIDKKIENCCDKLEKIYLKEVPIKVLDFQEKYFTASKSLFLNPEVKGFVKNYWIEHKYIEYENYQSLFEKNISW